LVDTKKAVDLYNTINQKISQIVFGKEAIKEALLLSLFAGGHVLIEGFPGTAKTQLAKSFAKAIGGNFQRIQFTPDLMPADITGFYMYNPTSESKFVPGPIFANVVLADELNRTTPRTQSALLEAMQEHQVTIERTSYPLEDIFMVIATQVGAGGEGTYPLTDVQVDRFLLSVMSEYPSIEEEQQVLLNIDRIDDLDIKPIMSIQEVKAIRDIARSVYVEPSIASYISNIVNAVRHHPDILSAPSTRGSIALFKCSRIKALLNGRDYVIPDDVKYLISPALRHRIKLKPEAEIEDISSSQILQNIIQEIPVPKPAL